MYQVTDTTIRNWKYRFCTVCNDTAEAGRAFSWQFRPPFLKSHGSCSKPFIFFKQINNEFRPLFQLVKHMKRLERDQQISLSLKENRENHLQFQISYTPYLEAEYFSIQKFNKHGEDRSANGTSRAVISQMTRDALKTSAAAVYLDCRVKTSGAIHRRCYDSSNQ